VLVRGVQRKDRLMITNVRSKILGRVCRVGFVSYGGKLVSNSAVNR
jgi:hypothetical protein